MNMASLIDNTEKAGYSSRLLLLDPGRACYPQFCDTGKGSGVCDSLEAVPQGARHEGGRMNYFVEGLQGSGKSTLTGRLERMLPGYAAVREGEYSPVELAWCACMDEAAYADILRRYAGLRTQIEAKTHEERGRRIVCYTKVETDDRGFYDDLSRYEIYNNRVPDADFKAVILERFRNWNTDQNIFECSLFQNIVEEMMLFKNASDEEIIALYRLVREALEGREYHICYLQTNDVRESLRVIRRERTDGQGNERWFAMMQEFFDASPYAVSRGIGGEEALIRHFEHRQALELRICRELFADRTTVLASKGYTDEEIYGMEEKANCRKS